MVEAFSSSNSTHILNGSLEKLQSKDSNDDYILYVDITSRLISIQNNRVSSVVGTPDKVVKKITGDIENKGEITLFAVISSQESNGFVFFVHLSNLKVVRKNGKNMVKMTASSNELDASGKHAQDSINLNRIPEGKVNITISDRIKMKPINKPLIQIILGSTRQGRTSEKIYKALTNAIEKRTDVFIEKIDLRDFDLPFLYSPVAPKMQDRIYDPKIKRWSDTISKADAYIIIVPEYNSGYPGVLKNALDLLYKEWNGKKISFIAYSGGKTGGSSTINQIREVSKAFKMIPLDIDIKIPEEWNAFDEKGNFIDNTIELNFNKIIDNLIIE